MSLVALEIDAKEETWPLKETFRTSRGSLTEMQVVVVTIRDGEFTGRGEGAPIRRYNQTCQSVLALIESIAREKNLNRERLQNLLPPGAARNALDCGFWDLEAKHSGKRVWELAKIPVIAEVETSFTISLDTPDKMGHSAKAHSAAPILKLKLGGDNADVARVEAVRDAAPNARLLIDANESWTPEHFRDAAPELKRLGVELIEQPFPANVDEALETLEHPIPVCADESCHTTGDLPRLKNRYEMINVKLDKTGGLTEALRLCERAREAGFKLLIGCMVGTSLGMAPARLLASNADYTDLDGPLLLARDREHGLHYSAGKISLPAAELWG
ncbi:MAG TPA: N-acetyl-D-Glu racemase DgcA [Chthoniobacterales bacterium]|nr:N-acetyl-D-Glu racemase DgcA [Chthoniobacterales bacterium]